MFLKGRIYKEDINFLPLNFPWNANAPLEESEIPFYKRRTAMFDALFLALILVVFAGCALLVRGCERL